MSDPLLPSLGTDHLAPALVAALPRALAQERKGIDLAVIKRGAKDFLDFLDASKEIFYAYLYHRTGSSSLAKTLMNDLYMETLSKAMSLWWFGTLGLSLLLDHADRAIREASLRESDLDSVYLPTLVWFSDAERASVSTLHDALWTLPSQAERLLILSLCIGLSDERIAELLGMKPEDVTSQLLIARDLLLVRWQPIPALTEKLQSLVFVPSLDLASETTLRFSVVEKYNALRFRRYQWVILGGLFAVVSNVIVASVLAFAVITQPPTSLHGTRTQVASLDAVLLKRQMELSDAKNAVRATFTETQRVAAYASTRDLTALGLASALESLKAQQIHEADVSRLMKLMEQARTAMEHIVKPIEIALDRSIELLYVST